MRLSCNWLKELLPDMQLTPTEVAELLTMHSFETEVVGTVEFPAQIVTAKITKLEPHPNADRLRLATITTGEDEVTVVCGAPNIYEGAIVPYAPVGTVLRDEEGEDFVIREAKIRGVVSPGMLNSLRELGLSHDHSGIWLLPPDTPLGEPLAELVPTDTVLEADVTPNRAHDCLSHLGVAREIAALTDLQVKEPTLYDTAAITNSGDWHVDIQDTRLCPRYIIASLDNLTIALSPLWLQARLLAVGAKPINNLVDITNYVLFEIGNPTHFFDRQKLGTQDIHIRSAQEGEKLTALDEQEYTLTPQDLVIATTKPQALAGVMGGQDSGITETTQSAALEAATFNAYSVQETSRRHALRSESSSRFSKDIDPSLAEAALKRALQLAIDIGAGEVTAILDTFPGQRQPTSIRLDPKYITQVAGTDIPVEQVVELLQKIRCSIENVNDELVVTVPLDRRDLTGPHDLAEEVIRIHGLEHVPSTPPDTSHKALLPNSSQWRERVRDFCVTAGLVETYNYSFEDLAFVKRFALGTLHTNGIVLRNPVAPEQRELRTALRPRVFQHILKNKTQLQHTDTATMGLFEVGVTWQPEENTDEIKEIEHIALVVVGADADERLSSILHDLLQIFGLDTVTDEIGEYASSSAHKLISKKLGLPVASAEVALHELIERTSIEPNWSMNLSDTDDVVTYQPVSKYPAVYRDISLLLSRETSPEQTIEIIERAGGNLLVDVDLFDLYTPDNDPGSTGNSQQSMSFHLVFQADDRTLSADEVAKVEAKIITTLEQEIQATVKG